MKPGFIDCRGKPDNDGFVSDRSFANAKLQASPVYVIILNKIEGLAIAFSSLGVQRSKISTKQQRTKL